MPVPADRLRGMARRAARSLVRLLPPRLRFRLMSLLAALPPAARGGGLVSLVVLADPRDQHRLADCLRSLRAQSHPLLEVLVCPIAGTEVDLAAVDGDPRFRTLPSRPDLAAAAADGARAASGRWLGFVRGCDSLPPPAVAAMARSLGRSASDLAVGRLEQRGQPDRWWQQAQRAAHADPASRVRPAARPRLASDLALGNRLFSTAFWRHHALALRADEDWLVSGAAAAALAAAEAVDVLGETTYAFAPDHGRRPFAAMPSPLPDLPAWRATSGAVAGALAGTTLADGYRLATLDHGLPRFIADAERADEAQWEALARLARKRVDDDADLLPEVGAYSRTLLWLAAHDRRRDVERLAAEAFTLGEDLRAVVVDDGLVACWESLPDGPGQVPPAVRRLTRAESPLLASVRRVREVGGLLEVDVFLRVPHLDLAAAPPTVTARRGDRGLPVVSRPDVTAQRWAQDRFASAAEGSFRIEAPSPGPLTVTLAVGALTRATVVDVPVPPRPVPDGEVVLDGIRLDATGGGEELVLSGTGSLDRVRLAGPYRNDEPPPGARRGRLPLTTTVFGRTTALPTGRYRLSHPGGMAGLEGDLPLELAGSRHRLQVLPADPHAGGTGPELLVGPPFADDEIGPYAQQRLRERYQAWASGDAPVQDGVWYFESYAGRTATDSPRAICEELLRRHPELTVHWGILDHAQEVPEGARPLLIRSREWWRVLATARCLVTNTELEEWYVRRADQFVVQTFHGYPSKAMGRVQWDSLQLPPSRVAAMRRRNVETWDLILTPTPEMTRHYREQYGYSGEAFEHGYPRNDGLRGPAADRARARTRALLGIGEDQVAVLYAPTWRDHLATRPRAAAMPELLDVGRAARELGERHVLLLRGHRFHTPTAAAAGTAGGAARVVDVTAYPEVNDVILAADVAVLDYSSMRFDVAHAGKPMVFLVPDLAEYEGGVRGFLHPFTDTTPGPLVTDTAEVVSAVRDPEALLAQWRGALTAFDERWNPHQDGRAAARVVDVLGRRLRL